MMKTICLFYDQCLRVMQETAGSEHRIGWGTIYNTLRPTISKITSMKFLPPLKPEEECKVFFKSLENEIVTALRNLADK
ncbi:vacuolar ATP synthase catalytic subunit A, putative [Eimeria necatrix]|uniref:Vacuolar ATP synthase catalytic subunit A, putative n=1 Tax=Eimeria necatrix TaxID=51315 RepID=U6N309_9EIME|nr:vacuolar ATP synthase catalytic subunit A, putative [Eimeria necatrix]CDJ70582.1 vacuolar ATP synthase catalytic subunit A, putative [Eimeria necatrix]